MSERDITESDYELTVRAVNAVMGRDQVLPQDLADKAEHFVSQNSMFSGLVQVDRSGDDVALVRATESELKPDFRFEESVAGELMKNKRTASGERVSQNKRLGYQDKSLSSST